MWNGTATYGPRDYMPSTVRVVQRTKTILPDTIMNIANYSLPIYCSPPRP